MNERLCPETHTTYRYVPAMGVLEPEQVEVLQSVRYCGLDEGHEGPHMTMIQGQPVRWPEQ